MDVFETAKPIPQIRAQPHGSGRNPEGSHAWVYLSKEEMDGISPAPTDVIVVGMGGV